MNSFRTNNLSWKFDRFSASGCKDIGIRNFELKTEFLSVTFLVQLCDLVAQNLRSNLRKANLSKGIES